VGSIVAGPRAARAQEHPPSPCDSADFCVGWGSGGDGHDGDGHGGSSGGPTTPPPCSWVTTTQDWALFYAPSLPFPPAGLAVIWQVYACPTGDGSNRIEDARWVPAVSAVGLADLAFGRIAGDLPPPLVHSDPPVGTDAIINVPVFVQVANWTGVVTASETAARLTVTVTATPQLTFTPGEPGSSPRTCAGPGVPYDRNGDDIDTQAAAPDACTYAYQLRTGAAAGRPDTWPATVSVTWTISWAASDGETGTLSAVTLTTSTPRGVREVQTVVQEG
jgi:hypothetical protein